MHHVVTADTGSTPVLLLDDVFSELDPERSAALLANLPSGQTLLTTAGNVPPDAHPDIVLRLRDGAVTIAGDTQNVGARRVAGWLTVAMGWQPLPGASPPPTRLGDTLDRVLGRLGAPSRAGIEVVFDRWPDVVGEAMAGRTRPVAIDGESLVVACDEPALATHVRFLEPQLVARARRARRVPPDRTDRSAGRPRSPGTTPAAPGPQAGVSAPAQVAVDDAETAPAGAPGMSGNVTPLW